MNKEEITNYKEIINIFSHHIEIYEERLRERRVPEKQSQWIETILDNLRMANSYSKKQYESLINVHINCGGNNK